MDVAFVGRFIGDRRVVRFVSRDDDAIDLVEGASHTLVETYCQLLADGAVPPVIHDTSEHPVLREMKITQELRIRSYIGVRVELSDGQLHGTLCCAGHLPAGHLEAADLDILRFAARYVAQQLEEIGNAGTHVGSNLEELLAEVDPTRIVIELTEHDNMDHEGLANARRRVGAVGARLAIDDMGAGFAGLTRLVDLRPDVIKLDRALVRGIDQDPARQALAVASLVSSERVGSELIAEGVELPEEAAMLAELGVSLAQGYHYGHPAARPWLPA